MAAGTPCSNHPIGHKEWKIRRQVIVCAVLNFESHEGQAGRRAYANATAGGYLSHSAARALAKGAAPWERRPTTAEPYDLRLAPGISARPLKLRHVASLAFVQEMFYNLENTRTDGAMTHGDEARGAPDFPPNPNFAGALRCFRHPTLGYMGLFVENSDPVPPPRDHDTAEPVRHDLAADPTRRRTLAVSTKFRAQRRLHRGTRHPMLASPEPPQGFAMPTIRFTHVA